MVLVVVGLEDLGCIGGTYVEWDWCMRKVRVARFSHAPIYR